MPVRVDESGARELKLTGSAALELERACARHDRARQVYDGLVWLICRKPDIGKSFSIKIDRAGKVSEHSGWIIYSKPQQADLPQVQLVYDFTDEIVHVKRVRCWPDGHGANAF